MNAVFCTAVRWFFIVAIAGGWSIRAQQPGPQTARRIQANDILNIRVLGEPDMNKETKVTGDGTINYFFVQDVQVAGLTIAEAQEKIRQILMKDWFVNPQVNIEMKEYAREIVTVLGQVNRPGTVLLPSDRRVDIVEVIGMAGDFTRLANKSRIELVRKGRKIQISYDELKKITDPARKLYVEPDDVIEVGQSVF
ncbi:MAG: polysaccharide export protein [Verrucomicrobiae bacterium]|nr:polysaccharide export protein [Verrucomicrobiae bacterium]